MRSKDLLKDLLPKTEIKSKVRFKWIFDEEISKTIESLAVFLDKELDTLYWVEYVDAWKRNIKIKVDDEEKFIFRMVNIVFDYTSVDEKYGNTRIELTFSETSKKPRFALVGKFHLLDSETIHPAVLKAVIAWLEEIYE